MHFHVPKPLHGWREFAGEVGIIVLGVLIALGFQQLAEAAHDRIVADQARDAIRAEVGENLWWLEGRKDIEPCVDRRLAQLGTLLDEARRGETFAPIPPLGVLSHAKITTRRWEANAQAGRASLFSESELRFLGNMYYTTDQFQAAQDQEETLWSKMRSIQGLRQLTPLDIHDMSIFLAEARYQNFIVQLTLVRAQQWADQLHIAAANPGNVEKLNNPNHVSNWVRGSELCKPLDRQEAADSSNTAEIEP
jgi:hypothetical protein